MRRFFCLWAISVLSGYAAVAQFSSQGSNLVHSANGTTVTIKPESNSAGTHLMSGQSLNLIFNDNSNGSDVFTIRGNGNTFGTSSEFLRVTHLGNIGIGTSSPTHRLEVHSEAGGSTSPLFVMNSDDQALNGVNTSLSLQNTSTLNNVWSRMHFLNSNKQAGATIATHFRDQSSSTGTADLVFVTRGSGTYSEKVRLTGAGRLGVGTANPNAILDVRTAEKSGVLTTLLSNGSINDGNEVHRWTIRTGRTHDYPNRTLDFGMISDDFGQNPAFYVAPKGVEAFRITENGNVGIGTTNPVAGFKLSVNGEIRTKGITVESNWADFVFEDDYNLRSLETVEAFIDTNKHLPDVPKASVIAEKGQDVGKTNVLLLQKVEELTLYLIEQNKLNKQQQEEIQALRKRLEELEK